MSDARSNPDGPIVFRSYVMVIQTVFGYILVGVGAVLLLPLILGSFGPSSRTTLYLAGVVALAVYGAFTTVRVVEAGDAALTVKYLFWSRQIPWETITEVRLRRRRGLWCIIRHGRAFYQGASFPIDSSYAESSDERDRFTRLIVRRAGLKEVEKTAWGMPVYRRG